MPDLACCGSDTVREVLPPSGTPVWLRLWYGREKNYVWVVGWSRTRERLQETDHGMVRAARVTIYVPTQTEYINPIPKKRGVKKVVAPWGPDGVILCYGVLRQVNGGNDIEIHPAPRD